MSTPVKKTAPEETVKVTRPSEGKKVQHPLLTLREEVDHLFDNFFTGFSFGPFSRKAFETDPLHKIGDVFSSGDKMLPHTDIVEREHEYRITAELPGMDGSDVEVTVDDGVLRIAGEKKSETREDRDDYHLLERHYGSVLRTFPIPDNADQDHVSASFAKGVLTITMAKLDKPKTQAKKIPIKG
ncbi:Hsp20/alpha crystallin family protein [Varunaivibrio sulfuroxidans]|uniref:Heat shock protein Hsp20 n=1 Tax=Varunaivibrio sulfuroxidans TaxID=1773489 RepID=A0A4R3JAL5_9PROT|nr:Hsp20/alpha crystallin family protein [Varunaivibrio sulfuroxidans]TCS63029.1 heat shock protein Hsp20 [Varunaivibrio sulfuroxidans]WES31894.1 Hsp20/alpha crystallin family protein [Varunaivibrio sulfuroxidans]